MNKRTTTWTIESDKPIKIGRMVVQHNPLRGWCQVWSVDELGNRTDLIGVYASKAKKPSPDAGIDQ